VFLPIIAGITGLSKIAELVGCTSKGLPHAKRERKQEGNNKNV
jgi:hypothetical protein